MSVPKLKFDVKQLKRLTGLAKVAGTFGGLGWLGYHSLFSVDGGHRGVVFNRLSGVKDDVYGEGTHLILPWFEWPTIFDVRTRPIELSSFSGTRDLQHVNISLRVLFKPAIEDLPNVLRKFGPDYDRRILPSIINETLKSVVAMYNAEQLTTQREEVSVRIKRDLQERAQEFNMIIQDCAITHLEFSASFAAAVEDKQIAQQEAEQARFLVQMAEQDKKSMIIQAEGQAQAAKLIGDAMKRNPVFAELKRLEAARNVAKVMANSNNRLYLNSDALLVNLVSDFVKQQPAA
jgi:prohibitin 2